MEGGFSVAPPPGVPSWITSATIGRWGTVPASNTLSALNPKLNATLNPSYPGDPPWGATQRAVFDAWCSMSTDPDGALWAWGGGHADYGGNEPYKLDLTAATPVWVMKRPPSGSLLSPATDVAIDSSPAGIAASATGFFSDGRPRPTHTYGSHVFVPGKGLAVTNLLYCWPHVNGPKKAVYYSETGGDWGLLADYSALGDTTGYGVGSCYDSSRNCVWFLSGGSYNMVRLNVADGTSSRVGTVSGWVESPVSLRYDAAADLVYIISSGYYAPSLRRVLVFDPTTGTIHTPPAYTGTGPAGFDPTWLGDGAAWDAVGQRWLIWNGSLTDRATIATMTKPAGDPRSTAWVLGSLTIDAGNTVTPTVALTNRTYNRFDYIPSLGICVLCNAVSDPVYFFKVR